VDKGGIVKLTPRVLAGIERALEQPGAARLLVAETGWSSLPDSRAFRDALGILDRVDMREGSERLHVLGAEAMMRPVFSSKREGL
jgi:hypothetical protein